MKIGIVMGYKHFSLERIDYKAYLDFVAAHMRERSFDKVILCGGFTDPKLPTISEAATIKSYFLSIYPEYSNYILEEGSINSNQNIEFAARKIGKNDEVFIYCDLLRLTKIAWIAMHFILGKSQEEIAEVFLEYSRTGEFIDISKPFEIGRLKIVGYYFPQRSLEETITQYGASIIDVLSLYNKKINEGGISARKEFFGL